MSSPNPHASKKILSVTWKLGYVWKEKGTQLLSNIATRTYDNFLGF